MPEAPAINSLIEFNEIVFEVLSHRWCLEKFPGESDSQWILYLEIEKVEEPIIGSIYAF
jgi:hypothetical protein